MNSYAALRASIALWLNRENLAATIPSFIALAESDIANALRDRRMHRTVTTQVDCGTITLPTDYLEAVDVRMVGALTPLRFLPNAEANSSRTHGFPPPRFYALLGNTLTTLPEPVANPNGTSPEVQLTYFARPAALSADNPTNWVLAAEPALYLYGGLLHAAPFLIDDERVPLWERAFSSRIDVLTQRSKEALASGGPLVRGRRGFG